MSKLADKKCEPCTKGASKLEGDDLQEHLQAVPEWELFEGEDGVQRIRRAFDFKNFAEALAFTNKVGNIAEEEGHHPAILTEYGKVTVTWWTHKIGGLHQNDFIMAARTDRLG